MRIIKSKQFHLFLALILSIICAVGVFFMSNVFQGIAYWGEGLTWYWIGVSITYSIWLLGVIFLANALRKGEAVFGFSTLGVGALLY